LALAKEEPSLHFFWARACPHCEQQKVFLKEIKTKYPDLKIYQHSLHDSESIDILKELIKKHPGSERYLGSVPLTFVGEDFFVGFSPEIGNRIENSIRKYYQEIGDFGVLVYSGFKKVKAPFLNFLSAITVVFGGVLGFLLSEKIGESIIFFTFRCRQFYLHCQLRLTS